MTVAEFDRRLIELSSTIRARRVQHADAEDIAQKTVAEAQPHFLWDDPQFWPYAFGTAKNLSAKLHRRPHRVVHNSDVLAILNDTTQKSGQLRRSPLTDEQRDLLWSMIDVVIAVPLHRQVVRDYADGLSYRKIAKRLGCSSGKVSGIIDRAKQKLIRRRLNNER